jgi:hypothetical protein
MKLLNIFILAHFALSRNIRDNSKSCACDTEKILVADKGVRPDYDEFYYDCNCAEKKTSEIFGQIALSQIQSEYKICKIYPDVCCPLFEISVDREAFKQETMDLLNDISVFEVCKMQDNTPCCVMPDLCAVFPDLPHCIENLTLLVLKNASKKNYQEPELEISTMFAWSENDETYSATSTTAPIKTTTTTKTETTKTSTKTTTTSSTKTASTTETTTKKTTKTTTEKATTKQILTEPTKTQSIQTSSKSSSLAEAIIFDEISSKRVDEDKEKLNLIWVVGTLFLGVGLLVGAVFVGNKIYAGAALGKGAGYSEATLIGDDRNIWTGSDETVQTVQSN